MHPARETRHRNIIWQGNAFASRGLISTICTAADCRNKRQVSRRLFILRPRIEKERLHERMRLAMRTGASRGMRAWMKAGLRVVARYEKGRKTELTVRRTERDETSEKCDRRIDRAAWMDDGGAHARGEHARETAARYPPCDDSFRTDRQIIVQRYNLFTCSALLRRLILGSRCATYKFISGW